ncbi:hypothetical protein ABZ354_05450 [Streptomyces sp. NPDC005925]|uniref:hypothetical protein n=1 Tax=Streptomyces sp. NPDC005925 TaxID=3157172 RepID=UPI0033D81CEA
MHDCAQCRELEALKASTRDRSLQVDCAVLLRRHPDHTPYPASVVRALRTARGGGR